MPTFRELVIEWVIMIAIGVTLAALGPFGSFAIGSFGARLAYWLPAAIIGYAIFRPVAIASTLIARRLDIHELPAGIVGMLVAAVPGAFGIAVLGGYRMGTEVAFEPLFQLYVQVALIGILVLLMFFLIGKQVARPKATGPAPDAAALPIAAVRDAAPTPDPAPLSPAAGAPFLRRLPTSWRDRLVALEMEDHYVRAYGPDSSALILLRMRDAEAELAGIDGLRVHRSWWVRRSAVERVVRSGRELRLHLAGGLEAPVSRDRVGVLKTAGWLD